MKYVSVFYMGWGRCVGLLHVVYLGRSVGALGVGMMDFLEVCHGVDMSIRYGKRTIPAKFGGS